MKPPTKLRKISRLLILALALILPACVPIDTMDSELSLKTDQAWEVEVDLTISAEGAAYTAMIAEPLNEAVQEWQSAGLEASWEALQVDKEGRPGFKLKLAGNGYELLNEQGLSAGAVSLIEIDGKPQIYFNFFMDTSEFGVVSQNTFTLHGGKIVSSNGEQLDGNSVRWVNPAGSMEAVMDLPGTNWTVWLLVLALLAGAGFGLYWVIRSRRFPSRPPYAAFAGGAPGYPPQPSQPAPGSVRYCSQCGKPLPEGAMFCPECGAPRI